MKTGPVCIITGASGGIASGIARELSARDYRLILLSRSGCGDLAEELDQTGIAGSVLVEADMEAAAALAIERHGRLDCAVFSGGRQADILKAYDIAPAPPASGESFSFDPAYLREPFDIPFEAWHANYDMNVLGPMRLLKAVLPPMRAQGAGAFVALSGIEALQPRMPYPLGPNRLALHGFAKLLSDRFAGDGIRINCVAPGLMENAADEFPDGWKEMVPAGRYGAVSEIAATVAFLLSPEAGYITGQTLVADGGVNRNAGL
ncbi:MAG: SDR family oxidoreductase [Alphaproteobacteria bacterium]|nr:SDR family oxidoreductase [Alphaproteobacteria bacterium]